MKLKDGFLALTVAAMFGAPVAFAQQEELQEQTADTPEEQAEAQVGEGPSPGGTSLEPMNEQQQAASDPSLDTQREDETAAGQTLPEGQSAGASDQPTTVIIEEEQSAGAATQEPSTDQPREEQPAAGAGMGGGQQMESGSMSSAQSDVPPPVDSETVRSIQQALNEQGQEVKVDGIWGRNTHQALQEFQRSKNLDASGQIDAATMRELNIDQQQTAAAE